MGDQRKGGIAWTQQTWNCIRGCSIDGPECQFCYAMGVAARFSGLGQPYEGLARFSSQRRLPQWTGKVRFVTEHLDDPLRWTRPRLVFVNSMSDLFHEELSNEQIAAVFGVMAACPQHTFQCLTKRAERMREWFKWARGAFTEQQRGFTSAPNTARAMLDAAAEYLGTKNDKLNAAWRRMENDAWPLPNVHLGVSAGTQATADAKIPHLLACPAAVRWVSVEPQIGPVSLRAFPDGIGWVVQGGESSSKARAFDLAWMDALREECRELSIPYFAKQLGSNVLEYGQPRSFTGKADDPEEWPERMRVREYPQTETP